MFKARLQSSQLLEVSDLVLKPRLNHSERATHNLVQKNRHVIRMLQRCVIRGVQGGGLGTPEFGPQLYIKPNVVTHAYNQDLKGGGRRVRSLKSSLATIARLRLD